MSDPRADAVQEPVCFILLSDSLWHSRCLQGMEPLESGCYNLQCGVEDRLPPKRNPVVKAAGNLASSRR
jgi:hypothetical protein